MMTAPEAPEPDMAAENAEPADTSSETASLPIDFCPGMTPKEGDTFTVKVVSVDEDNGSIDVAYVPSNSKPTGSIKAAAAKYDQEGE